MFEKVASPPPEVEKAISLAPTDLLRQEIDQVSYIYNIIVDFFANYTFQLIGAFIIFSLGYLVAGKISNVVLKLCTKHKLDITLSQFLASTTKMLIVVMITVISLSKLGISVTPFIAAIGAISLGAGLALQGLLANYAAGFNIIIIRPFVVGDTITVQGVTGVVQEVLLAYTIIYDQDGVCITIPNKHIVGEILHNSKHDSLLELTVGIAYKEDPLQVIAILEKMIDELNIVGESRLPQIGIDEFADSSINISIRLWTPTANFYDAKFKAYKAIYLALKENNIEIPFPQRDVHLTSKA
ncbi:MULTISPECIES: mechanosensitive ion channel family protein [unclassified Colwellia]|uniref:mechanosensitive ion channel family protein n=1 Tax=unclassified Colwellia TaxID=196834 RepID=UPI0015F71E6F|nr:MULTISPECIES: mechanosensitive ion channel family protein [unclassified Colwellia]MBA6232447.1 mechanosensitive ion channel family protein [Colwellia sp. MB02u-7]MBA6238304.1 mechanosensitive ion channel family protein [Colwellia sp. MB02u-11]MBA6254554.1 mechanosensitive ion channel family protein [Colwellia sp. MB3u-28]MBA6258275.1 mechanosensitive ion channel family protein [Colwellia sp. MB3u-41]MBA6301054.1 mechanosensitive ion channel family protein [Colwellia sp. MB3u-22]